MCKYSHQVSFEATDSDITELRLQKRCSSYSTACSHIQLTLVETCDAVSCLFYLPILSHIASPPQILQSPWHLEGFEFDKICHMSIFFSRATPYAQFLLPISIAPTQCRNIGKRSHTHQHLHRGTDYSFIIIK